MTDAFRVWIIACIAGQDTAERWLQATGSVEQDRRTADEIIDDVIERAGLEVSR